MTWAIFLLGGAVCRVGGREYNGSPLGACRARRSGAWWRVFPDAAPPSTLRMPKSSDSLIEPVMMWCSSSQSASNHRKNASEPTLATPHGQTERYVGLAFPAPQRKLHIDAKKRRVPKKSAL